MNIVHEEYIINCSPKVLYSRLSTVEGLSEWFADNVRVDTDNVLTFEWDGSEQSARMDIKEPGICVRFDWEDDDDAYFQFTISINEMTKELSLVIDDCVDDDDVEETRELWDKQIDNLKKVIGY